MPRKPAPKADNPEQSERFIETARKVSVPGGPETFEEEFKKVAEAKRVGMAKPSAPRSRSSGKQPA